MPPPQAVAGSASNCIAASPQGSRTLSPWRRRREVLYCSRSLYLVSHLLHKLVLEGFKAVETDRGHVAVLHRDRPLGRLVLSQEREVLQHDMQLKRTDSGGRSRLALVSWTPKMSPENFLNVSKK